MDKAPFGHRGSASLTGDGKQLLNCGQKAVKNVGKKDCGLINLGVDGVYDKHVAGQCPGSSESRAENSMRWRNL